MRHLTTTEIAHTNGGGLDLCNLMGNCPYATTIGWTVLGMAAGASYSHGILRNNAKILQWTLSSGVAAAAINLGIEYALSKAA